MHRLAAFVLVAGALLLAVACSGGSKPGPTEVAQDAEITGDPFLVGTPQTRASIGDVDRAFSRYEATRSDLIELFKEQPWFQDGLTRDESLFVERSLTFVASYSGPRTAYVSDAAIRDKLYRYDKISLSKGETELLLIYEPGQNGDREMALIKGVLPELETVVGAEFPERMMTVVNGAFEINDFNEGQFIRIARCCTLTAFVLAHELAHSYWSVGPSWFNEGMADIYATLALARLNDNPPAGWTSFPADIESYYKSKKQQLDAGRFPDMTLPRRLASDGLYEVADVFLLDIRKQLGDEAFRAAARDIYLASDYGRFNLRDKRIEDIFLSRARANAREPIMTSFNRAIWGDNGERYDRLREREGP